MFFYNGSETTCKNGFSRKTQNIFQKSLEIINKENFDSRLESRIKNL